MASTMRNGWPIMKMIPLQCWRLSFHIMWCQSHSICVLWGVLEMENVYLARTFIRKNDCEQQQVRLSRRQTIYMYTIHIVDVKVFVCSSSWVQKYLPPQTTHHTHWLFPFYRLDIRQMRRLNATSRLDFCVVASHTHIRKLRTSSTPAMLSRESNRPCSNWALQRSDHNVSDVQTIDDT